PVVIGAHATQALGLFSDDSDTIEIKPGGSFLYAAPVDGVAIVNNVSDTLKIAGTAGDSYKVVIVGTSA
ncbi:MAG: hypothetical protein ACRD1B_02560, partial [Thermoanaerobaculia bacterium]